MKGILCLQALRQFQFIYHVIDVFGVVKAPNVSGHVSDDQRSENNSHTERPTPNNIKVPSQVELRSV